MSKTVSGKIHDINLAKELNAEKNIQILADLGFLGLKNKNISIKIPFKKSKKKILTENELTENRLHNSKRVLIEHVFAHLKTLRILKDKIRSYKSSFKDLVMTLGAQLYNFKILTKLDQNLLLSCS